jgi:hypothetical protein
MKGLSAVIVMCGLLLVTTSLWAEGNSIRGVVVDAKGRPVAGAEIRAERTDAKGPLVLASTDAKGKYVLNPLATGTYKVIASVYRTPRSAARVRTSGTGWVEVDFTLKDSFGKPQRVEQSAIDRIQGQDLRRMQQDQPFGH